MFSIRFAIASHDFETSPLMQMKIDVNQMFSFKAPFLLEELYKKKYTLIHWATLTQKLVPDLKVFIALTKPASLGTPNPGAEIKVRVEKR